MNHLLQDLWLLPYSLVLLYKSAWAAKEMKATICCGAAIDSMLTTDGDACRCTQTTSLQDRASKMDP